MKIAFYCQHVLGVGHFHRSLEICKSLAADKHDVTMILGGPDISVPETDIRFLKLPGMEMDENFKNLLPCNPSVPLEQTKQNRAECLLGFFKENTPDLFITELYPFGRKAFRFELDPVLQAIQDGEIVGCKVFCSLRDILVERKDDQEKFDNRVIKTLHKYFDGLLIHSDKRFIPLEETFKQAHRIEIPKFYTGFVGKINDNDIKIKKQIAEQIPTNKKLIVASIGGGNVGGEFLITVARTFAIHEFKDYHLQIFTGLYSPSKFVKELQTLSAENISVSDFTPHFSTWLSLADLSISMAGYNSCMDAIIAKVPALLYPFSQNHEQQLRVEKLQKEAPLYLLTQDDLTPEKLAKKIQLVINKPKAPKESINIDGAAETSNILTRWHKDRLRGTH